VIPVIAVAVGALLGGEAFGIKELAGAALVVGGMWLALRSRRGAVVVAAPDAHA
jgi:drug/metabolite transporter (DMT)-like permease